MERSLPSWIEVALCNNCNNAQTISDLATVCLTILSSRLSMEKFSRIFLKREIVQSVCWMPNTSALL